MRDPFLLFAGIEDRRAVAGAYIVALAIARARVMNLEEELEELSIAEACGIKNDLNRFGVVAMVAIGGVRHAAASVAGSRR